MAASSVNIMTLSVVAAATITQFRGVTAAGAVPAAGANVLGFAAHGGDTGARIPVVTLGTAIAESGAAITAGALVEVDDQGRAIPRTSGAIVGRALTAAGGAGEQVEVLLIPN